MKHIRLTPNMPAAAALALLMLAGASAPALAQAAAPQATAGAESAATDALSEGEITRWDARTLRVTLRHGELKNLDMPPMTMVFRVKSADVMNGLQPGDKVRFRAEQVNGAFHATHIEKAP
ncbi:copper-binding protein [Acidovorax sp.]|uniref:copper-binding protein n=1 Tax=Acidovorax sp. TaxID=1872122 RepID=UPI00262CF696|nr:copper-binding protein [Acidovorax sp.]